MARSTTLTEWAQVPDYTVQPDDHTAVIEQNNHTVTVMLADILAMQANLPTVNGEETPPSTLWQTTARGLQYRLTGAQALNEDNDPQPKLEVRGEGDAVTETIDVLLTDLPELADACPTPPGSTDNTAAATACPSTHSAETPQTA